MAQGHISLSTGVSPPGGAWGGLERSPTSWMAGNAGAGLRQRLAAWAKRERGRSCAKWGEGCARGTGRALWRELGAWAGVVAEKTGDVRECAHAGPWRARRGRNWQGRPTAQRDKKGHAGQWLGDWRSGPATQRERERAKETGVDRSVPLGSERGREGAREAELPLTGGVRLLGDAGARPGWA
jgi:hypothetical protein